MSIQIIHSQSLINDFLRLVKPHAPVQPRSSSNLTSINLQSPKVSQLSRATQSKLINILSHTSVVDQKYRDLFNGHISHYGNDHSAADLALTGYFLKQGLSRIEADLAFRTSKLFRAKWDEKRGSMTYGERTIEKAYNGNFIANVLHTPPLIQTSHANNGQLKTSSIFLSPSNYQPIYYPFGMPPREFIGPKICDGTRLFPAMALSSFVALGGVGKTSLLISIAAHLAAGKSWNLHPLTQQKVAMFFCEETQEEINRKFSATIDGWSADERKEAIQNFIGVSLLGKDARLTLVSGKQYAGSGITDDIIQLLADFNLRNGLVILDHMQGFTSGDLNSSETSTAISLEANRIVEATGSAVVLAAHVGKKDIKAESIEQGSLVGSLAFENATRQMSGLTPMSVEQARKYGLEGRHRDYVLLVVAKNSYGAITEGLWLKKVYSPKFHTVVLEPIDLQVPIPPSKLSEYQKIANRIMGFISKHSFVTRNKLDMLSGTDNEFQASKTKVRDVLKGLINSEEVIVRKVTEEDRQKYSVGKQVKEYLILAPSVAAKMDGRK